MHHLRNLDNLFQIKVLPMEFAIQEGGRTVVALGRRMAVDHEDVSEALLEAAVIREEMQLNSDLPVGHVTRDLTADEIEWINENHPEWVAEICDEEWQQENNPEY